MTDPRLYGRSTITLAEMEAIVGCGALDGSQQARTQRYDGVASLELAGPGDVSLFDDPRLREAARVTRAGVCLVHPDLAARLPATTLAIEVAQPRVAFNAIVKRMYGRYRAQGVISPLAFVDDTAEIGEGTDIEPGAVIKADVVIGIDCTIEANCVIGEGVRIGDRCRIGPGVSLQYCRIGHEVVLHAGVRIGTPGFGTVAGEGEAAVAEHIGRVVVHDRVEIGANSTVDRGLLRDTVLGPSMKSDNLVQIAHNCEIGEGVLIAALAGIAGRARVGRGARIGGQVGVREGTLIGAGTRVAAQSGVMRDTREGEILAGTPAIAFSAFMRQVVLLRRWVGMGSRKETAR